jgi:hypothetical protein
VPFASFFFFEALGGAIGVTVPLVWYAERKGKRKRAEPS